MYRRVPCDWFLCDGVFRPVRLDAPAFIPGVLVETGVIPQAGAFAERLASEWIYRREWTYSAKFTSAQQEDRVFIKLTGIKGEHCVLLNGEPIADEEEVTGRLKGENTLSLAFPKYKGDAFAPEYGFAGMLMMRRTLCAAVDSFNVFADGRACIRISALKASAVTIKYLLSCGSRHIEKEFSEKLNQGLNEFTHQAFEDLPVGERCDITAQVYIKNTLSDEAAFCTFINSAKAAPRGFLAAGEAMLGAAARLGANTAFMRDDARDNALNVLAARHSLMCVQLMGREPVCAPCALASPERLVEVAGSEEQLKQNGVWVLTDSDKSCFTAAAELVPSGDIDAISGLSRYIQAEKLMEEALNARERGDAFIIEKAEPSGLKPASPAIFDDIAHPRPAYCALMTAWRKECAFTRLTGPINDDGIFSCDVVYVSDTDRPAGIRVTAFDINGKQLNSSSYAVIDGMSVVGRFISEMPEDGVTVIRTSLIDGGFTDRVVIRPGTVIEDLPETQLLIKEDRVVNAGSVVALGVSIGKNGFYGCMLPGEEILCGNADGAEGLNIYF